MWSLLAKKENIKLQKLPAAGLLQSAAQRGEEQNRPGPWRYSKILFTNTSALSARRSGDWKHLEAAYDLGDFSFLPLEVVVLDPGNLG